VFSGDYKKSSTFLGKKVHP